MNGCNGSGPSGDGSGPSGDGIDCINCDCS